MHISTEKAIELADGRLEPAQVEFWEKHFSTCGTCLKDAAEWRKLQTDLQRSHLQDAPSNAVERAFNIFASAPGPDNTEIPGLRRVLASIVFDSFQQPAFAGARGAATAARQLVLRAEDFDIHLKIWGDEHHRQMLGQMLTRSGNEFPDTAHFHLLRNGERLESTSMDDIGEFYFRNIPEGDLSLQIDLPHLTVVGALRKV
jgi:hypothetical protein